MVKLKQVESEEDIRQTRLLFDEYVTWLGVNLCFQNYDQEVAELPGEYVPPTGRLYIASENEEVAGCIALRKLDDGICEMKRLYIRPQFRGKGLGRMLVDRIIEDARAIGYDRMRLDTLPGKMDQAIAMYHSLGFKEIEPYYDNPYETAAFMELDLTEQAEGRRQKAVGKRVAEGTDAGEQTGCDSRLVLPFAFCLLLFGLQAACSTRAVVPNSSKSNLNIRES